MTEWLLVEYKLQKRRHIIISLSITTALSYFSLSLLRRKNDKCRLFTRVRKVIVYRLNGKSKWSSDEQNIFSFWG